MTSSSVNLSLISSRNCKATVLYCRSSTQWVALGLHTVLFPFYRKNTISSLAMSMMSSEMSTTWTTCQSKSLRSRWTRKRNEGALPTTIYDSTVLLALRRLPSKPTTNNQQQQQQRQQRQGSSPRSSRSHRVIKQRRPVGSSSITFFCLPPVDCSLSVLLLQQQHLN